MQYLCYGGGFQEFRTIGKVECLQVKYLERLKNLFRFVGIDLCRTRLNIIV